MPLKVTTCGAVCAVLLVAACGSGASAGNPARAGGSGQPKPGGRLTAALSSAPDCLDPQQAGSSTTITVTRQLVDSLTDQDPATGEIVPWLAESWKAESGARRFTFTLKDGVTFSDGTPLDAQAVKDNFDHLVKLGARAVQASTYLSGYRRSVAVDARTVRVEFDHPNAPFLYGTSTTSLGIVGKATLAKPAADRCASGVVGSGPFVLDHYTPNQEVVERRRDGYTWGSALAPNKGAAYLDQVVFQVVPEESVRVGRLRSGQADVVSLLQPQAAPQLRQEGLALETRSPAGLVYSLNVNVSRPLTADPAVRRAIQKAVDRRQIVTTLYGSVYRPATSVLAGSTPGYTDLGADLAADPAGAGRLLDGAGWKTGADGVRVKDGRRLSLVLRWFSTYAATQSALELVQQQLKAVGVDVVLKQTPVSQALQAFKDGDYDLILGDAPSADPDILRRYYTARGLNAVRLPGGPLQTALDGQAAESDTGKRAAQVAAAQTLLVRDAYAIPLFEGSVIVGVGARAHGVRFDSAARLQFHDAWVS
ncbi:ABC transporter substrate-binding protein [Microbispora sp. CA-135349]|uniref:ABC transporter substrate-binding protein n=1 Tax=Microbispora sp. CA-135349 TaxID=3239953 RepID=UPI003D91EBD8